MSHAREYSTTAEVPISDPEDDRLDRAKFASHVARHITGAGGGPSIVFGLAGQWGCGKSSILNMIEKWISANSPGWKVQRLTPWAASDAGALISEFYATIYSALPEDKRKKFQNGFAALMKFTSAPANAIPVVGKGVSETAKLVGEWLEKEKPFNEQFHELSVELEKSDTRMLVIVDDLDRLHSDELTTLFKVVRLLGSFPGIHYLLSYDQDTVRDVLSRTPIAFGDKDRALEYLEKIVQYPFEVPPLQETHRYREIRDLLAKIAQRYDIDVNLSEPGKLSLVDRLLNHIPDTDLVTLRSIHRLANQFEVVLTTIGPNEVNFLDLLFLTFLRLTYPELYTNLRSWKSDLTRQQPQVVYFANNSKKIDWRKALLKDIDDSKVDALYKLIRFIFPAVLDANGSPGFYRSEADYRRVSERDYFDRYFTFTITVDDISDADVIAGLVDMASNGALTDGSQLLMALNDERRRVAISKARNLINRVTFSSKSAMLGACALTEHFGLAIDTKPAESMESHLVADLLTIAVNRAITDDDATKVVDTYNQRYGLILTTLIAFFSQRRGDGNTHVPTERLEAALRNHRKRQFESCISDLSEKDVPGIDGIQFHWNTLNNETQEKLREYVRSKATSWDLLLPIAVRFLGTRPNQHGSMSIGDLHYEPLFQLVPEETWARPYEETSRVSAPAHVDFDDLSYANRLKAAEYLLTRALSGREPHVPS